MKQTEKSRNDANPWETGNKTTNHYAYSASKACKNFDAEYLFVFRTHYNITIEDLRKTLDNYSVEGKVCVFEIDGVSPNSYPKLR